MSGKVLTSIFDASVQLSSLQRYSMTKLVNPESVLEHQGSVAMMGVMLGIKLNSFGEDFDIGMIALKSSLHDIDEIGTGDIPRPTKYAKDSITQDLNNLAKESVLDIFDSIGIEDAYDIWDTSKAGRNGKIVGLCDGLAVLCKVWQETCLFGNKVIIGHAGPVQEMLEKKFSDVIAECKTEEGTVFIASLMVEANLIIESINSDKA
jgi:5'-deoxynucleotidase YfbR-like HD superfamily hydrolase